MTIGAPLRKGESIPMLKDLSGNGVTMAWSDPMLPTVSRLQSELSSSSRLQSELSSLSHFCNKSSSPRGPC